MARTGLVALDFRNEVPLPWGIRHVVDALVRRRNGALHVKDLEQLEDRVEQRAGMR